MKEITSTELEQRFEEIVENVEKHPEESYLVHGKDNSDLVIMSVKEFDELTALISSYTK